MNDEKPKSFWTKSWTGWRGLLLGWFLLTGSLILIFVVWMLAEKLPFSKPGDEVRLLSIVWGAMTLVFLLAALIRWICCWRNLKRFGFGLACFITLIALFYAEEDWRGKHDWEKFKREWEAKGERFDWQSIIPPAVPDDENFAFSPVWIATIRNNFWGTTEKSKSWYGDQIYSDAVTSILPLLPVSTSTVVGTNTWRLPSPPEARSTWSLGTFANLKTFQTFYRDLAKTNPAAGIIIAPQAQTPAQDVLLALSKFDPVIEKLRADSSLPASRFPICYNDEPPGGILLPHLAAEKQMAQVLQLHAIAELQNGGIEKSFADVNLMFRLVDASRMEPFIIGHLVRIAIFDLTLQPVWEGLAEHQWSDAQLVEFDHALAKLDFLADFESSVRGERALMISSIDYLRRSRNYAEIQNGFDPSRSTASDKFFAELLHLIPNSFFYQNELTTAQLYQQWSLPIVDVESRTVSPTKVQQSQRAIDQALISFSPYKFFARMFSPAMAGPARKFAYAQSATDLARVAIALERYRLANGNYPATLDALTPQFISEIPHDVINGEPLKYRREANGQFVLYSVGWNERDDGGVTVFKNGSTPGVDIEQGDWVWKYPKSE